MGDLDFDRAIQWHGIILATLKTEDRVLVTRTIPSATDGILRKDLADHADEGGTLEVQLAGRASPASSAGQHYSLE